MSAPLCLPRTRGGDAPRCGGGVGRGVPLPPFPGRAPDKNGQERTPSLQGRAPLWGHALRVIPPCTVRPPRGGRGFPALGRCVSVVFLVGCSASDPVTSARPMTGNTACRIVSTARTHSNGLGPQPHTHQEMGTAGEPQGASRLPAAPLGSRELGVQTPARPPAPPSLGARAGGQHITRLSLRPLASGETGRQPGLRGPEDRVLAALSGARRREAAAVSQAHTHVGPFQSGGHRPRCPGRR